MYLLVYASQWLRWQTWGSVSTVAEEVVLSPQFSFHWDTVESSPAQKRRECAPCRTKETSRTHSLWPPCSKHVKVVICGIKRKHHSGWLFFMHRCEAIKKISVARQCSAIHSELTRQDCSRSEFPSLWNIYQMNVSAAEERVGSRGRMKHHAPRILSSFSRKHFSFMDENCDYTITCIWWKVGKFIRVRRKRSAWCANRKFWWNLEFN